MHFRRQQFFAVFKIPSAPTRLCSHHTPSTEPSRWAMEITGLQESQLDPPYQTRTPIQCVSMETSLPLFLVCQYHPWNWVVDFWLCCLFDCNRIQDNLFPKYVPSRHNKREEKYLSFSFTDDWFGLPSRKLNAFCNVIWHLVNLRIRPQYLGSLGRVPPRRISPSFTVQSEGRCALHLSALCLTQQTKATYTQC